MNFALDPSRQRSTTKYRSLYTAAANARPSVEMTSVLVGKKNYCTAARPSLLIFPCTAGVSSQSRKAWASARCSDFAMTTAH